MLPRGANDMLEILASFDFLSARYLILIWGGVDQEVSWDEVTSELRQGLTAKKQ